MKKNILLIIILFFVFLASTPLYFNAQKNNEDLIKIDSYEVIKDETPYDSNSGKVRIYINTSEGTVGHCDFWDLDEIPTSSRDKSGYIRLMRSNFRVNF